MGEDSVQVADVQVAELDQTRHEAQLLITLSAPPSERWVELFGEARAREDGAGGPELNGSTISLWGRAESDALVRVVAALRELIERVNVRLALEVRMVRERAEVQQRRLDDLNRSLRRSLGLPD